MANGTLVAQLVVTYLKSKFVKKAWSNSIPNHWAQVSQSSALPTVHWIAVVNGCFVQHR